MVFWALNRSLWKDSCCIVLVMKGGTMYRDLTRKDPYRVHDVGAWMADLVSE